MSPYIYDYPRPSVTVDIVVFDPRPDGLYVLLIQRRCEPFEGLWALPGGFVEMEEALEATAHRELLEETGLSVDRLIQLGTYGDPGRDPRGRVISVVFLAVLPEGAVPKVIGGDDASQAAWFAVNHLPSLAFDHNQILQDSLRRMPKRE